MLLLVDPSWEFSTYEECNALGYAKNLDTIAVLTLIVYFCIWKKE